MATDAFTRANETPLTTPWVKQTGSGGNVNLSSNAVTKVSADDTFYYYGGAASSANQYAQMVETSATSNSDWGPAVRISTGGGSTMQGYFYSLYTGVGHGIGKFVGGTYSSVATWSNAHTPGQTARIEANGTAITGKINGATVGSATDSSLAGAGNGPGFFYYESGGALDNWEGGDLGGAASIVKALAALGVG